IANTRLAGACLGAGVYSASRSQSHKDCGHVEPEVILRFPKLNARNYRDDLKFRPGEQTDADQRTALELIWDQRKKDVSDATTQLHIFTCAVGLFAYGRLDVLEELLSLLPAQPPGGPRINARILARVVIDLIPIPNGDTLDPLRVENHAAILNWVS